MVIHTLYIVIDDTPISTIIFEVDLSENLELHKPMIPHFLALDVGVKISQAQLCTSIRGCFATFLVKNTLFEGEVS